MDDEVDVVGAPTSEGTRARRIRAIVPVSVGVILVGAVLVVASWGSASPAGSVAGSTTASTSTSAVGTAPPDDLFAASGDEGVHDAGPASAAGTTAGTTAAADPSTSTTAVPPTSTTPPTAPPLPDEPAVVARPVPVDPPPPPPSAPPAPWAASVRTTPGGHLSTDVGCAVDLSAAGLDAFFAARVGPVIGWDYQHVYPLGDDRFLWLFQDTFVDHSNTATTLDKASFVHNTALVQEGACFRLLHRGTTARPEPFEAGTGTATLTTWFWPMGGEVHDGRLHVFWVRMVKDAFDPPVPDGLGWHPEETFVGVYDPITLARLDFRSATQPATDPIYGYAVQSDDDWTYLFGNSFEQNLSREGGWANGPHSGTRMYLARVPRGAIFDQPTYWTSNGWTRSRPAAEPILQRHWAEFPFQPRLIDGRWVATTAVDGYWGDAFDLDVANEPWGPWTTVESRSLAPRGADPLMNTYHAHLMPWRDAAGKVVVSVSNNARNMLRDAWPAPARYRPMLWSTAWREPPAPPGTTTTTTTTSTTTTQPTTTTSSTTSTSSSTTSTTSTSTTTSSSTTSSTTSSSTTSTTSTTVPGESTTTSSTTEP